ELAGCLRWRHHAPGPTGRIAADVRGRVVGQELYLRISSARGGGLGDRQRRREHAGRERLRPVRPVRGAVIVEIAAGAPGDQVRVGVELAMGIPGLEARGIVDLGARPRAVRWPGVLVRAAAELPGLVEEVAHLYRREDLQPGARDEVPDLVSHI